MAWNCGNEREAARCFNSNLKAEFTKSKTFYMWFPLTFILRIWNAFFVTITSSVQSVYRYVLPGYKCIRLEHFQVLIAFGSEQKK